MKANESGTVAHTAQNHGSASIRNSVPPASAPSRRMLWRGEPSPPSHQRSGPSALVAVASAVKCAGRWLRQMTSAPKATSGMTSAIGPFVSTPPAIAAHAPSCQAKLRLAASPRASAAGSASSSSAFAPG
jgi:hypothetical protein